MNNQLETLKVARIEQFLLSCALFNLLIVAATGVVLRSIPVLDVHLIHYADFLHGHSHFAMGGWATSAVIWLIMRYFPKVKIAIHYEHWRNIIFLHLLAAYGMLISFPVQGYGPVSVTFSTISVASTLYFAACILKAIKGSVEVPDLLLKAAAVFLILSAAGPIAMGPIISMGYKSSALYYNAVYFYLHFQLNGFFQFVILAVMYRFSQGASGALQRLPALAFLVCGCFLSVILSFLWNKPGELYNVLGACGAVMQLSGITLLRIDRRKMKTSGTFSSFILNTVRIALLLKCVLQCLSAFQPVAEFAFMHRDIIVAYLHLFTLGVFTAFVLLAVYRAQAQLPTLRLPILIFISTVAVTNSLLVARAFIGEDTISTLLLWFSIPFAIAALAIFILHLQNPAQSQSRSPISLSLVSHPLLAELPVDLQDSDYPERCHKRKVR